MSVRSNIRTGFHHTPRRAKPLGVGNPRVLARWRIRNDIDARTEPTATSCPRAASRAEESGRRRDSRPLPSRIHGSGETEDEGFDLSRSPIAPQCTRGAESLRSLARITFTQFGTRCLAYTYDLFSLLGVKKSRILPNPLQDG